MEKIKFDFNVPQDPYVELYDPEDNLVLSTNDEKKFLWVCCQIKDAKAEGYYVVIPEEMEKIRKNNPNTEIIKHPISQFGRVIVVNSKMFHVYADLLRKLV